MSSSVLSFPHRERGTYYESVTKSLPWGRRGKLRDYYARIGLFDQPSPGVEVRVVPAVMGVRPYVGRNGANEWFGRIARVEAWCNRETGDHGMLILDNHGVVLVQVDNALFGYSGSAATTADFILEAADVPSYLVEQAHVDVGHDNYHVVFSQEFYEVEDDVKFVVPGAGVWREWKSWLVQ